MFEIDNSYFSFSFKIIKHFLLFYKQVCLILIFIISLELIFY